jgi:hypothetical protein
VLIQACGRPDTSSCSTSITRERNAICAPRSIVAVRAGRAQRMVD